MKKNTIVHLSSKAVKPSRYRWVSGGLQSRMRRRETWRTSITSLFSIQRWAAGSGSNWSWTEVVQLHLGCFPQGLLTQGGGSEGWHREKRGCVMHQGLKTICPKAAFPEAARGDGWCGAPQFPRQGVPSTASTPGLQEGDDEFKGTSFFIEGDPEHWKFTLKSRPPGHEFQE